MKWLLFNKLISLSRYACFRSRLEFAVKDKGKDERGSYIIPATLSLIGSLSLILTYTDLSNYIAAEQAAAAASRKILRCLVPSDGACVSVARQPSEQELDWYASDLTARSVTFADRYKYSAKYQEQDWVAVVPTLERRVVDLPNVNVNTTTLPILSLQGVLNQYERRSIVVKANGLKATYKLDSYYTPKYEPNFPAFDPDFESDTDQRSIASWNPRIRDQARPGTTAKYLNGTLPFVSVSGGTANVASQSKTFSSPVVFVPNLPAVSNPICQKTSGANCEIPPHSFPGSTFRSHAALAVKAFAKVNLPSGKKLNVGWKGSNSSIGLIIQFWNAAATVKLKNGIDVPPTDSMCLGGRDDTTVSGSGDKYVNLWLRGPEGSNGGTHAVCPGGRTTHFPISVERGGAFKIVGTITIDGGTAPVSVTYSYYFDDYNVSTIIKKNLEQFQCQGSKNLSRNETNKSCNQTAIDLCNIPADSQISSCNIDLIKEPVCEDSNTANDIALFAVSKELCDTTYSAVACSTKWLPSSLPECAVPPSRKLCGWQSTTTNSTVSIPTDASTCSPTLSSVKTLPCNSAREQVTFSPSGNYGDISRCRSATNWIKENNDKILSLNKLQPFDAPRFNPLQIGALSWATPNNLSSPTWVSVSGTECLTREEASDPSIYRSKEVRLESKAPILKHTSADWQPNLSYFTATSSLISPLSKPYFYVSNTRDKLIDSVYPFTSSSEFEIPLSALKDIPIDLKASCYNNDSIAPAPLDLRLRQYAANALPILANSDIQLQTESVFIDTLVVSDSGGCDNTTSSTLMTLPPCTPTRVLVNSEVSCGYRTYLGRYSRQSQPNGPAQCVDGTYNNCHAEPVYTSARSGPIIEAVNLTLAKQLGYQELKRAANNIKEECAGPGCAEITIDHGDKSKTLVTIRMNLPITFPLSTILNRNTLSVHYHASEERELKPSKTEDLKNTAGLF